MKTQRLRCDLFIVTVLLISCSLSALLGAAVFPRPIHRPLLLHRTECRPSLFGMLAEGEENARLEIVEVADFECRHTKSIRKSIRKIQNVYGDRLRYVFVPFSAMAGGHRDVYTKAYVAAGRQGKTKRMREELFALELRRVSGDRQVRISEALAAVFIAADRAGLNLDRFEADLHDPEVNDIAKKIIAGLRSAGVGTTPTLLVNGYRIQGARSYEAYAAALDTLLAHTDRG